MNFNIFRKNDLRESRLEDYSKYRGLESRSRQWKGSRRELKADLRNFFVKIIFNDGGRVLVQRLFNLELQLPRNNSIRKFFRYRYLDFCAWDKCSGPDIAQKVDMLLEFDTVTYKGHSDTFLQIRQKDVYERFHKGIASNREAKFCTDLVNRIISRFVRELLNGEFCSMASLNLIASEWTVGCSWHANDVKRHVTFYSFQADL